MRRCVFVVVLLLAIPAAIDAAPIRWDLQDVRFNDGAIATGHFILDVDAQGRQRHPEYIKAGDYSITSTPDSFFTGATYDVRTSGIAFRISTNASDFRTFLFFLKGPLTGRGGVVEILQVDDVQGTAVQTRSIATGSLVGTAATIPEPSLLTLFGVAAVVLRKRRFTR